MSAEELIQSDIFSVVYNRTSEKLKNLTNEKNLSNIIKELDAEYELTVTDIVQYMFDKNGDRIVVDEKLYDAPSSFQMILTVNVTGKTLGSVLRLYGIIARYLKDNPSIDIADYNWHMNPLQMAYLETVVRDADCSRVSRTADGKYLFSLHYVVCVGLNSQNAKEFVRVRERQITGDVK